MNKCSDEPDRKTYTEHNPDWQLLAKAHKGHKKKQNARYNAPQGACGVIGHQVEIVGVIQMQPDKYDKAGQRHHGN